MAILPAVPDGFRFTLEGMTMDLYTKLKAKYGDKLPDKMPNHWRFNAPPVCTRLWTEHDWVAYAAARNGFPLEDKAND